MQKGDKGKYPNITEDGTLTDDLVPAEIWRVNKGGTIDVRLLDDKGEYRGVAITGVPQEKFVAE